MYTGKYPRWFTDNALGLRPRALSETTSRIIPVYTGYLGYNLYIYFLQRLPIISIYIYFFYRDYLLYLDYSRYIYYFSKPWGCYVCMCVCNYIKFYECFLSFEAVCVYLHACGCV